MKNSKQKTKQYKTLLSTLANGSTNDARNLIKSKTGKDAVNIEDLQLKLGQLWATSDDKLAVEKEFASIHPHKDFILKYLSPKVSEEPIKDLPENVEIVSSCEGSPNCGCNKNIKPMVGFDGIQPTVTESGLQSKDNTVAILALVGMVGILGLLITKR